jgi:hypothetical protein
VRTWTATDECGNTATASQAITQDEHTAAPTFNADELFEDLPYECPANFVLADINVPAASDDCDIIKLPSRHPLPHLTSLQMKIP